MNTTWKCPKCGFTNEDDRNETMLPLCGGCGEQVFWSDIEDEKPCIECGGMFLHKENCPQESAFWTDEETLASDK